MLRARLDDDYGDDREAWCKALLPFVLARPARAAWAQLGGKLGLALGGASIVAIAIWYFATQRNATSGTTTATSTTPASAPATTP